MAQSKLSDLAGRFAKSPKGAGTGLKVLAGAAAAMYGVSQSMYTGKSWLCNNMLFGDIFYCL
jgi:prohibitin 2